MTFLLALGALLGLGALVSVFLWMLLGAVEDVLRPVGERDA